MINATYSSCVSLPYTIIEQVSLRATQHVSWKQMQLHYV